MHPLGLFENENCSTVQTDCQSDAMNLTEAAVCSNSEFTIYK